MLIIGAKVESNSSKYDFKTLKVRPLTYKKLIKLKSSIESEKEELYSFDGIINYIIDKLTTIEKVETFSANDIKQDQSPEEND